MTPNVIAVDHLQAAVAGDVLVGLQRRRTGDVGLHAGRRLQPVDDVLDGLDGLVGQRLALVAAQVHLDVGGLAVVALRAGRGERVAPEVLDVLDVCGVGLRASGRSRRRTCGLRRRAVDRPPARSSPSCRSRTPRTRDRRASSRSPTARPAGSSTPSACCPTTSSWGTTMLTTPISAIQPRMIGTARWRIHRGRPSCRRCPTGSRTSVGVSSVGALMRSSPGRRSARSRRWCCSRP